MEWDAPAIVLDVHPYGEHDAIATVMTEVHGRHRGLARGGASRAKAPIWQPGNLVRARWAARLPEQLGTVTADLIHASAALAMDEPLALSMLSAVCAVAAGALPEHEAHPRVFAGLLQLLPRLPVEPAVLSRLVEWEITLLADLGYGLDLSCCAVTGRTGDLAYVSPKTGRAVTAAGAGPWSGRLLPLPGFLMGDAPAGMTDWRDGLRLTGHFLARDAFGLRHLPLPRARQMLYDRVSAMIEQNRDKERQDG